MMTRSGLLAAVLAAVGMIALAASEAHAIVSTTATGFFTSDHCTGGCLTGQPNSGGSVSVTDNGTGTLAFSFQLFNGNQFINTGFDASLAFQLAPSITSITYSGITPAANYSIPNNLGPGQPLTQTAGNLHVDGTGFFRFGLEGIGNGGSNPLGSTLSFSITAAGLDLTDLDPNAKGQFFAADILSGTTGNTGALDVSVRPTPGQQCINCVPEPGSLVLLGSGLAGLGPILWWQQRRRRSGSDNGPHCQRKQRAQGGRPARPARPVSASARSEKLHSGLMSVNTTGR